MPPRIIQATLHRRDVCTLGEGPFWHNEQLWWVDIEEGRLLSADGAGNQTQNIAFGQSIGSAVPAQDGTFLVALRAEIARLHLDSKQWDTIVRLENLPKGIRFNDGKCDPRGRLIVGTMSHANSKDLSLYVLHHDHALNPLRGGISISNGLAWSADGETMYFIDTPALCVVDYDYNLENGSISHERTILRFSEEEGRPDGMTIDREGRLWISFWDGWSVRCYRPETGVCETIVRVPCARPTSCCFGGANMDRLFITTARSGLSEEELRDQPLAGSIFVCEPGASGFPASPFVSNPR
jgi:sugar lactone lactonase YvrE